MEQDCRYIRQKSILYGKKAESGHRLSFWRESYASVYTATKPGSVKFRVTAGKKKAQLKWNRVKGVSGYTVYYKASAKAAWKKLKSVKGTSYTVKKLKSKKSYSFTVRAYKSYKGKTYTDKKNKNQVKDAMLPGAALHGNSPACPGCYFLHF